MNEIISGFAVGIVQNISFKEAFHQKKFIKWI